MARPDIGYRAAALLYLRVELADRHSKFRAGLQHPSPRVDERQVLIVGKLDQPVQHRIVEYRPPVAILLITGIDRAVVGFEPLLGDRGQRRGKVGTDETP